ncbi:hypothetical protein LTR46_012036, partial [Exophiala xenobiotica]
ILHTRCCGHTSALDSRRLCAGSSSASQIASWPFPSTLVWQFLHHLKVQALGTIRTMGSTLQQPHDHHLAGSL